MEFNTLLFLGFFAAAAVINYALPRMLRPYFLLIASYAFYLYNPDNAALVWILLTTTAISWAAGLALEKIQRRAVRVAIVTASFLSCGGFLFYFKYLGFFDEIFASFLSLFGGKANVLQLDLVAPLGLSYFIFASLGYVVDQYRRKYPAEKNPLMYGVFVSFFPCIFTGPIERYDRMSHQFKHPRPFSYDRCAGGAFRMLWGYFKKMVLADNLAVFVSSIFSKPENSTGPQLLLAILIFSMQLYMDFSGCCDIAIGGARILGFDLLENFNAPFMATSFSDFWRRWHMSLTGWFRDYLYIPLGGSRHGKVRHYINLVIVFLVSGLWHGAAWGYVLWGLVSGVLSAAEVIWQKNFAKNPHAKPSLAVVWLQRVGTYVLFSLSLTFFMSALYGVDWSYLTTNITLGWNTFLADPNAFCAGLSAFGLGGRKLMVLIFGTAAVLTAESRGNIAAWIRRQNWSIRWTLYYALGLGILFYGAFGQSVFIYQQY